MPSNDNEILLEALIREVEGINTRIIDDLSEAGFSDIPRLGPGALIAIASGSGTTSDLARHLRSTGQAAGELIDELRLLGYLDSSRKVAALSKRGSEGLSAVVRSATNARWKSFAFRDNDIVISSVPKSGTTWVQMACALLIFQFSELPAPLPDLSPCLESKNLARDAVYSQLAAQRHRRFVKTHLPLDKIPVDSRVTYVVVARHPLDVVVSLYHHLQNLRVGRRVGPPQPAAPERPRDTPRDALLKWIDQDHPLGPGSLPGMLRRLSADWAYRNRPNVVFVHYDDLSVDLEGEMKRLAARLGIKVPADKWPALVTAATFERMRASAKRLQPVHDLTDEAATAFFRSGASGTGRALLTDAELARYAERAAQFAPPDLLSWLHRALSGTDHPVAP
jgi:aryl sulfotransferase